MLSPLEPLFSEKRAQNGLESLVFHLFRICLLNVIDKFDFMKNISNFQFRFRPILTRAGTVVRPSAKAGRAWLGPK
jgi:hypothetical protein